jgi:hypothetical protein
MVPLAAGQCHERSLSGPITDGTSRAVGVVLPSLLPVTFYFGACPSIRRISPTTKAACVRPLNLTHPAILSERRYAALLAGVWNV